VTTGLLQAHPEIRGIFAINDETALGALMGLRALGRDDVVVVGYDAIPEARDAIASGSPLEADVVQHPHEMGAMAVRAVASYLRGIPVDPIQAVPVSLVTRESLKAAATDGSDNGDP
jgi:ribose transport system substrate-binding protein